VENAGDKTASSPQPSPPEDEREKIFQTRSKSRSRSKIKNEEELFEVFHRVWDGKKRREIALELGLKVERVKALQAQLRRRLARFGAEARGGVVEVLTE